MHKSGVGPTIRLTPAAFGYTVKVLRGRKGLTQERLAARGGLRQALVSDVEQGRQSPSLRTLQGLAHGLGLPLSEVIAEVEANAQVRIRPDSRP